MSDTRQKLLDTALAVFTERGVDGGSMREIARRAEVNVATPYHHFASKRDLFMAIFREKGFLDAPAFSPDQFPRSTDPVEALEVLFFFSWLFLHSGADVVRLAITEGIKGDADVISVFEEWQRQGDGRIEEEMLLDGLADETNVARRSIVVRQIIWGTFVANLVQTEPPTPETLRERARDAAVTLIEGWR